MAKFYIEFSDSDDEDHPVTVKFFAAQPPEAPDTEAKRAWKSIIDIIQAVNDGDGVAQISSSSVRGSAQ